MLGFLLKGTDFHILIELDHAVTLRVADVIPEDGRAFFLFAGADEEIFKPLPKKMLSPRIRQEWLPLMKSAARRNAWAMPSGFGCVMYSKEHPHWLPSPKEFAELPAVVWRGDDGNLTDARQKENRQRIIDHRLIVDRQQLFADAEREGMKPRTGTARQQDTFP